MVAASINLSDLNGSNGFVINGPDEGEFLRSVSRAGDVNSDGIDDVIIGTIGTDPNGNLSASKNYVVFGNSSGFDASFDLSNLDGSNGFVINNSDNLGFFSVSDAGDVNGDGIDDVIIGASGAAPNGNSFAGESYVVFGSDSGFNASLNLSDLDGSDGFTISGIDSYDSSGLSVSAAGDVNGDGFDDVIIGATGADPNGNESAGESYVVFGSSGFDTSLNLSTLDGKNGFVINGIDSRDSSGRSVSAAGDVNGDGIDDVIIGASGADPSGNQSAGESYVVFGNSSGFDSSLDLSDLDGSNGFTISGIDPSDRNGRSVSNAGDVNGDGIDDIIIASPGPNFGTGQSYVVFGRIGGFGASLDLSSLDGSNGFTINGIDPSDQSGYSLSSAGDVNGDGIDDVIIGAPFASDSNMSPELGESYVVFGSDSPFPASLDLSSLDGSNGFLITGLNPEGIDEPFISVSGAGDVNSDGFDDIIIGTDQDQESYVIFGFSTVSNDTIGEAIATGLSSQQPGTFSLASAIGDDSNFTPENDVDILEFQLDAGDGVIIDIDAAEFGSSLDPILRLFDSNGNEVAVSDDNPAPGEDFTLDSYIEFLASTTDTYYVGVSSFSNFSYDPFIANSGFGGSTGDYEIEIEVITEILDDPNDTIGEAIATGLSSEQPGTFSLASAIGDDSNFNSRNDVDLLEFQLDAGDGVTIDIDADELGSSLGSVLRLFDSNGNEVAVSSGDPAPGEPFTNDSYIEFLASTTDTYYVGVSSSSNFSYDPFVANSGLDGFSTGDYEIEIEVITEILDDPNDTIGEAIATGLSSEQPGTFSVSSTIGDDSTFNSENDVDILEFQLDAGDTVTLDIDAAEFGSSLDPILRLFDSNGNEVAVSDDTPAPGEAFTLDSYIEFIAPSSDTYYVGVSSFSNFSYDPFVANSGSFGGSTGDYEIEIEVIAEGSINGTSDPDELVGTEENDTINGFEGEDTVAGNAGDDLIDGGDGDDVLRGDFNSRSPQVGVGGNDTIIGGAGNDRIGGKGGDDQLFGSEGDDSIWGDDGDDLINGGLGDDLLTGDDFSGGSGSDTFILAAGEGTDTITDFELGIDQIDLEGLTFEDLSISTMGNQTEIAFGDETLAILQGVTETLTESDFV